MIELKCKECDKIYTRKQRGSKYCSSKCYGKSKVGKSHNWGDKISESLKGVPKTPEHIQKVIDARKGKPVEKMRGDKHFAWKGDMAGYSSLHDWVRLRKPTAQNCAQCEVPNRKITQSHGTVISYLHLANLSGEYKRDTSDWEYLCPKCHSLLDKGRDSIRVIFKQQNRAI